MLTKHLPIIFNVIWFQTCWFACVLMGNKAALVILSLVVLAYLLVPQLRFESWLLIAVCSLGFAVDFGLLAAGVLKKSSGGLLPPLWLSVLWLAFATTINHSLKTLMNKKIIFLLLAVVGGPLCYKIGVQLTDIQFGYNTLTSLLVIAGVWLLAGMAILRVYNKWDSYDCAA